MEEDKFKDLLEDEELKSLRLAALATKRKKEQNADNTADSSTALPINSIVTSSASESVSNQIPFVQSYNNSYSWRKQNQSSRRRGGAFPKSTRSNLIVISPVSLNDCKDVGEKGPALVLPQHKWCNSGNEDSMSPKTLRRTGPTRFNRHGSDSESSESDYENENDSGSNETVLQDEPSEHFPRSSPDSDVVPDSTEKKRRLSFQNLESEIISDTFDKGETTGIYNLLKNPAYDCSENKSDNYALQNQIDGRHAWSHSAENDFSSYKQFNSGNAYVSEPINFSEKYLGKKNNSLPVNNGESCIETNSFGTQSSNTNAWQHTDIKTSNSYYSRDASSVENSRNRGPGDWKPKNYLEKRRISSELHTSASAVWQHGEGLGSDKSLFSRESTYKATDSRNYKNDDENDQFLSEQDLRFELKKRLQEMKSKPTETENKQDCSNLQRSKNEHNFIGVRNDHNSSFSHKQRNRSLSRERNKQESCSVRDSTRFGYSSGPERSRRNRSSSHDRGRRERSVSRGRSRGNPSQDKRRNERSSSQGPNKCEYSSSPNRNKRGRSFSKERDEHSISQNRNRFEWSSSQFKSRRKRSSSSDSRRERSASQDSGLEYCSNQSRNKKEGSISQDRNRRERSSSRDRSGRIHSSSRDRSRSRHSSTESRDSRHSQNSERIRKENSSSPDDSEEEHSSKRGRRYKHISRNSRGAYNKHSNRHKIRHSSQDKDLQEHVSSQEMLKEPNKSLEIRKLQSTQKPESFRQNSKFEKNNKKDNSKSPVEKRLPSGSEEERRRNKISPKKRRVNDSYRNRYSRSRSSSSTSYSSSSSTPSSRPKIRSISSVIKSVSTQNLDIQNKETVSETKSFRENASLNTSQADASSTCSKKNVGSSYSKLASFKCVRMDADFRASDSNKRVPVHMRLGALPRKRVIQMPKDVEAAFVNSSSSNSDDENVNTKCKRQNIRIVTDVYGAQSGFDHEEKHSPKENSAKQSPDLSQENSKRLKIKR